jgi:D-amino-acid dehydrogenase
MGMEARMSRTAIVGAGVIGLTLAHELARRGEEVVLLERRRPGSGSSAGNAGWIVPSVAAPVAAPGLPSTAIKWMLDPESPLYVKPRLDPAFLRWLWSFFRACREEDFRTGREALLDLCDGLMPAIDRLRQDGVDFEMESAGLLVLGLSTEALGQHYEETRDLDRLGYRPAQRLTAGEARERDPMLSERVAGAVYIHDDRHVRPESLVAGLTTALWRRGVEIRSGTPVTGFVRHGRRLAYLELESGRLEADRFVLAAGAWSGRLSRAAGFPLPIEAGKGYSITVDEPSFNLRQPLDLIEARTAVTPFRDALRFAGTMELSGINLRYARRRAEAIWRNAHQYLREQVRGTRMRAWVGMRPMTPDGLPVIGRLPGSDNLFVATGHQMLGVTLAPTTAIALSQLMLDGRSDISLVPFDPVRFI